MIYLKRYGAGIILGALAVTVVFGMSYAQAKSHQVRTKTVDIFSQFTKKGQRVDLRSVFINNHKHASSTPSIRTYTKRHE